MSITFEVETSSEIFAEADIAPQGDPSDIKASYIGSPNGLEDVIIELASELELTQHYEAIAV